VKALFTVEEEIGMLGVKAADLGFFDDAAFVFSNDSPDKNRATHYSSGIQLYSDEFFNAYLQPICKEHGVTSFRSEPWTCIKEVRRLWKDKDGKHLECLNFGNAGDKPHSDKEGASFSGVCNAEELLYALCSKIPLDKQHVSDIKEEPRPKIDDILKKYPSYQGKFAADPKDDEDFGSYVDELFGLRGSDDWQSHDDTDICQFEFTYDDEDQFKLHQKLCEQENLPVTFDGYHEGGGTAMAEGELQSIKDAYVLWYQIFYDDPSVRTWDQLEDVDDLSDFNDGLIFFDDLDDTESVDDIQPENLDDEEKKKPEQMDLFDWINRR